jgi:hypothetical protein
MIAINLLSGVLTLVGKMVVYLWDSLCNLFRSKEQRRPVQNPFTSGRPQSDPEEPETHTRPRGKLYSAQDGEYIDYEEVR